MNSKKLTLSESELHVWREGVAQLRHLSDDVFKSVALFMGLNLFVFCGEVAAMIQASHVNGWWWVAMFIGLCGIALTLAARFMLKRHRIYYLEMLAKKSLLERELGFYESQLEGSGIDRALPWRLKPEVIEVIAKDFDGWVQRSIRSKGTMVRVYFLMYEAVLGIHGLCFVLCGYALMF